MSSPNVLDDLPDASWLRDLPKAEVHVHLEASMERDELVRLADQAGEPMREPFQDLAELLDYLDWTCSLVRTEEELERLAYRFVERKARSGIRYLDIVVNPTHWGDWQERLGDFLDALDRGFQRAEADGLPPARLCVSILRTQTAEEACRLADFLAERRHPRVAALSIDGNEAATGRTGERFAPAFEIARRGGLATTAHAGESSGPEGVRDAMTLLQVQRIDHGVRAVDDDALVRKLVKSGLPLGVCPLANARLGMWGGELGRHPVDRLRRAGVRISVNTDDPVCPEYSLEDNYLRCAETFGWTRSDVVPLIRTSIEASFAPPQLKQSLLGELDAEAA